LFHGGFGARGLLVERVASLEALGNVKAEDVAGVVIEPMIQGAAGMRLWPPGTLTDLRTWCNVHDTFLILDEVMTGFGRTGRMFACEHEGVIPDFIALAKGLSGGYLPLAATLTTEDVFNEFLGDFAEQKTFYYGHSYTGNQLGCAAALANLAIFREERALETIATRISQLAKLLRKLSRQGHAAEIRQCGFIAGIELRRDKHEPYPAAERIGTKVCLAARKHGLLTRPIGDTIVVMPPYCITAAPAQKARPRPFVRHRRSMWRMTNAICRGAQIHRGVSLK
jgi:adenosylmethionine-8-amino-7-oxononanoate aminotransferase